MQCPDEAEISEFAGRALVPGAAARIEAHMADCDGCRKLVFALASRGELPASAGTEAETRRVGRFEVLDVIGQGAMGVVYQARDPELDRLVAVKVCRAHAKLDVDGEDRLRREAQALARLAHPNVVTIHEIGPSDGRTYVAMEYVDGVTLDRWLVEPRQPRAIVNLLAAAGRGLAAAHQVGLVHRDVKPSNILVSAGGVAKVSDFGLVRIPQRDAALAATPSGGARGELEMMLSVTGSILGTPAYMAPEQLRGEVATEASDQFGFCVTTYEALYGVRPFVGTTIAELLAAMEKAAPTPPVPHVHGVVPSWILDVLHRGLRARPEDRWPSMMALVDALEHDPVAARRQRLRRVVVAVALAALGGLAVFGLVRSSSAPDRRCQDMGEKFLAAWSPHRADAVRGAFASTKRPYAADTFTRVASRIDGYARAWTAARGEACEATQLRGDQSAELMDLRMACLDRRLADVDALVSVFATSTSGEVVDKAVAATENLPSLAGCSDVAALRAIVPPPTDPATRAKVDELRGTLAKTRALLETGQYRDGLPIVQATTGEATKAGFSPLVAEALYLRANFEEKTGDVKTAAQTIEQAIPIAAAAHDDALEAELWADLVYVVGVGLGRTEDALRLRPGAEAALRRAGTPPSTEARFWNGFGGVHFTQGHYPEALQHYQRALTLKEAALGPDARDVAAARLNLGVVLNSLGKFDEAEVAEQRALESWKKSLGPDHPDVAHALTNLGENAYAQGKYAEARGFHERALAIYLNAIGPDQRDVAAANNNLGNAVLASGDIAGARTFHERALATYERIDPNHADVAATLTNLGSDAISEDNYTDAERYYTRAIPIFEKALGLDHPDLASPLNNLGMTLSLQGKYAEARPLYERAVAVLEKALGPEHPDLGQALTGLGTVLFSLGELRGARTAAERAVRISEVGPVPPGELGAARFALAQVLWAQNVQRPHARELAAQARDEFSTVGAATEQKAADAWLRSHH